MAFNIKALISDQREVKYLLFNAPVSNSQSIYLNFTNASKLFSDCCMADRNEYEAANSPDSASLFHKNLYVYGFIYEVLSNEVNSSSIVISTKTGAEVRKLMVNLNKDKCRPIFILDECTAVTKETFNKVRFVRNCFRSLGLGLVMLGTDSRAAKLTRTMGNHSRTDKPLPWCFIFGKFPALDLTLLKMPPNLPFGLQEILVHSRPLFSQLAVEALYGGFTDFDKLMSDVFSDLLLVKNIFEDLHGQLGQLRLFQNAHYSLQDWDKQSTPLIHSHFAQINGVEKNFVLMSNAGLKGERKIWKPSSAFPLVENDILLYFLLMGGKYHSAFILNDQQVPYAHFLMEVKTSPDERSHILDLSNSVQTSNDGMFLESLLCSTVCLASHSNGIQGIGLQQFLLNLVYQLQPENLDLKSVTIADLNQLDEILFTVPFLSPPNQSWPDFLRITNAKFGALERTRNSEKIDLWASCGFAGESKDYGSEINLDTLRKIIHRIPEQAIVELVYTRKLQNSYFNPPALPFDIEFKGTHHLERSFYKIDASKPNTVLEPIIGLPCNNRSTKGVVIFVEIDSRIVI